MKLKYHLTVILLFILTVVGIGCINIKQKGNPEKPNVLFIAIDDLRTELGCYDAPQVKTPHIDNLASQAVLFERAYCNVPTCGASRASLLSGILPTRERFTNARSRIDQDTPGVKTLPQAFKEAGYTTLSAGKIFDNHEDCEAQSWSEPAWYHGKGTFMLSHDPATTKYLNTNGRGRFYEHPDVKDEAYPDGQIAVKTIENLRKVKDSEKPFFIACGFLRPHLPFYAPKKYWDLYERDSILLAKNRFKPKNAPKALKSSGEYNSYHLADFKPESDSFHQIMRHGYYASTSFVDKLVGDVLKELKSLGLDKNTIVVLWGDHGWLLGEHNFWAKHSTMHQSMRVPLIIKVPGQKNAERSKALVESTDIFPTLCELADLNTPATVQGESFKGVLKNPSKNFRDFVYCRYKGRDAIVTDQFSYTRFSSKGEECMLFDHKNDPEENENVAVYPSYKKVKDDMREFLDAAENRAILLKQ